MTCHDFIEALARYLARELPRVSQRRAAAHVASCRPCNDYLHGYREAIRIARSAFDQDAVPADDGLISRILAARDPRA
jgi:hypothetical protein